MTTWVVTSWVLVGILTAINIFVFIKLKSASEKMLKMAFPGAKDMNEALSQMQTMMGAMQGRQGGRPKRKGGGPPMPGQGVSPGQLQNAMSLLQKIQKGKR